MIRSCSNCLILAAVFQVIFGQDPDFDNTKLPREPKDMGIYHPYQNIIPQRCRHPPRDVDISVAATHTTEDKDYCDLSAMEGPEGQKNISTKTVHAPEIRIPVQIDLYKCCPRPHLYSHEVLKRCGIEPMENNGSNDVTNFVPKRSSKTPCQDGICLMQNANLLKANESIDYEKLGTYIDEWAAANPDFTAAILAAKPICGMKRDESWYRGQPPLPCDPDKVFICFRTHMLWNCKLKEFEECQRLGEHIKECKPYYDDPNKKTDKKSKKSNN